MAEHRFANWLNLALVLEFSWLCLHHSRLRGVGRGRGIGAKLGEIWF